MVTEVKSLCTKSVQCCDIIGFFQIITMVEKIQIFLSSLEGCPGGSNAYVTTLGMKEVTDLTYMFAVFRMKKNLQWSYPGCHDQQFFEHLHLYFLLNTHVLKVIIV